MELIKPIVKIGNSSGVVLPRKWLHRKARIQLIQEVSDIAGDIIEILINKEIMKNVMGIYLTGSYARGEQREESDIDVLIISNNIDEHIKEGIYDLMIISKRKIRKILEKNILPILPMLREAKSLMNESLIEDFKKIKINKKNLKWHIETTKSALRINDSNIKLSEKLSEKNIGDAVAYSLILRLREVYIVDCLKKNKLWKTNEFVEMVKKISGSVEAYDRYLAVKNRGEAKEILKLGEAKKLLAYLEKKISEQKKWLKEIKD